MAYTSTSQQPPKPRPVKVDYKRVSKRNSNDMPDTLYAVVINRGCFVHRKIYVCERDKSFDIPVWEHSSEDFSLTPPFHLGLEKLDGIWTFVSSNKEDAELFHKGAKTAADFLNEWSKGS